MSPLLPLLPNSNYLRNRCKGFELNFKFPKSFRKMVPLHAPQFKRLRRSALLLGVSNALIIIMGIVIVFVVVVVAGGDSCKDKGVAPVIVAMMVSVIRISAMIATGIAQQHAASSILTTYTDLPDSQAAIRQQRRKKYRKLLLWTRIASVITMLQLLGAVFLLVSVTNLFHSDTTSSNCLRDIKLKVLMNYITQGFSQMVQSGNAPCLFFLWLLYLMWVQYNVLLEPMF